MKRYTVSITRPVTAAEYTEDADGAWVKAADIEDFQRRVDRARGILGGAFIGTTGKLREKIGMALEALEGKR